MKHIILCADDYGQNTSISQAIIELLRRKSLSATSCMTSSYYWSIHAQWLDPFKNQIDVGLHFNLTEGKLLTKFLNDPVSLSEWMKRAYLGQLNQSDIEAELHAQIDQFEAGIGRLPDFIDGHQHIHQLPIIRDAVFSVYDKRLRSANSYIRCVHNKSLLLKPWASGYIKTCVVQLLGSFAFKKALVRHNIPHNSTFAGFYHFNDAKKYRQFFPKFVNQLNDYGLIMCHPGEIGLEEDPIANARTQEYAYFQSDAFKEYCLSHSITLSQFR